MFSQPRLDLAQLDAEAADLDLEVVAAQVFDVAIGQPAAEVAGAVHARPRIGAKRRHHKTLRRQRPATPVAARHTCPTNVQLPHHPDRDRRHPTVQYVDLQIRKRNANHTAAGRLNIVVGQVSVGDMYRCFGNAVHVVEPWFVD